MSVVWSHLCCRHRWLAEQNADFIVWHVFNVQRNWSRPDLDQLVCTSPADRTRHILSRSFLAPPVLVHPFPSPQSRVGLLFVYWHHFIETYCRARGAWLLILWFSPPLSSGVVTNGRSSVSVGLRSRLTVIYITRLLRKRDIKIFLQSKWIICIWPWTQQPTNITVWEHLFFTFYISCVMVIPEQTKLFT